MSIFDDKDLGGREFGPVNFRFHGDVDKAKDLTHIARKYLGMLKSRALRSEAMRDVVRFKNGVEFHMNTVRGPLIDTDWIDIFVPLVPTGGRRFKIIGYIVQCFYTSAVETALGGNALVFMQVTTPSGKEFGDISFGELLAGSTTTYDGYPDNGAKYIAYTEYDENFDPILDGPVVHQALYFRDRYSRWSSSGYPYVYNDAYAATRQAGLPALNSGWEVVSTYTYSSGSCGPYNWEYEAIPPCFFTMQAIGFHENNISSPNTTVVAETGVQLSTLNYTGGWHSVPFIGCFKDEPNAYPVGSDETIGRYNEDILMVPPAIVLINQASEYTFNYLLANEFVPGTSAPQYERMQYGTNPVSPNRTYYVDRRADDHGLLVKTGFYRDGSTTVLTNRSTLYGHTALFMIPEQLACQWDSAIHAYNTYDRYSSTSGERVGDFAMSYLNLDRSTPTPECDGNTGFNTAGIVAYDPPADAFNDNLTTDFYSVSEAQLDFVVPCKCEAGVHEVEVIRHWGTTSTQPFEKVVVWLMVEGYGFRKVVLQGIDYLSGGDMASRTRRIRINVQEVASLEALDGSVNLVAR